jgi:hypothetical protein
MGIDCDRPQAARSFFALLTVEKVQLSAITETTAVMIQRDRAR